MNTMGIILLAVIAYLLWRIYRQREDDKNEVRIKEYEQERKLEKNKLREKYPNLIDNIDDTWLELFGKHCAEKGLPILKAAWFIYVEESTKMDNPEGCVMWDSLWDLSEELLEHLEKYHEGSKDEYEIAIITYWQIAAQEAGSIIEKNPMTDGKPFQSPPFTDIQKIASWFPKKQEHPEGEISFVDEKTGLFPRESKGSPVIEKKLRDLGL